MFYQDNGIELKNCWIYWQDNRKKWDKWLRTRVSKCKCVCVRGAEKRKKRNTPFVCVHEPRELLIKLENGLSQCFCFKNWIGKLFLDVHLPIYLFNTLWSNEKRFTQYQSSNEVLWSGISLNLNSSISFDLIRWKMGRNSNFILLFIIQNRNYNLNWNYHWRAASI